MAMPPVNRQVEYSLALEQRPAAIAALTRLVRDHGFGVDFSCQDPVHPGRDRLDERVTWTCQLHVGVDPQGIFANRLLDRWLGARA